MKGNPGGLLCLMAHSLRFYGGVGLVSGLSLTNHPDSQSFLVVPTLLCQDASDKDSGKWSDTWCLFD